MLHSRFSKVDHARTKNVYTISCHQISTMILCSIVRNKLMQQWVATCLETGRVLSYF